MSDEDDEAEMDDQQVFDTTKSKVSYIRSKDTTRVTVGIQDPNGISEMKLYLILCLECEQLEKRLGISEVADGTH